MAGYTATQLGIKAPAGGFQDNGWYNGRNYDASTGTFGEPNQNWSANNPDKAKSQVSAEVRGQSAAKQGVSVQKFDQYLAGQGAKTLPQQNAVLGEQIMNGGAGLPGGGMPAQTAVPDLSSLYKKLMDTPEIQAAKKKVADREAERDAAISEVQNNPWYSQGTRGGKIAAIQSDAERDITRYSGELSKLTANAETELNINLKQYDLTTQARQQALNEFNTLLSAGALTNASAQDIATIAQYTGISASMVQSAVQVAKTKGTSLQTYDDGTNQYVVALDSQGNVINKQVIGASKPKDATQTQLKEKEVQINLQNAAGDARKGATLEQLINHYGVTGGLTVEDIYRVYGANTNRGAPKETLDQVKKGIYANRSGFISEFAN